MSEYYYIDRIEGEYAVNEWSNKKLINIKWISLPNEIKEGDCLKRINGKSYIDNDEKNKRKKKKKKDTRII